MNRRNFVRSACAVSASLAFSRTEGATPPDWRTFEVKTRVEILKPSGATRVWLPAALSGNTPYQKTLSNEFKAEGGTAHILQGKSDSLGIVTAEFPAGVKPILTLTNRVATRNHVVDLSAPRPAAESENRTELKHFLRPTKLLPTDGIVKQAATEITRGADTDLEKARAVYEWIVDNTFRNPKTRGCGRGDIRFMLESKDLSGKCADLNALYVGVARAAGLPARDGMASASPNRTWDTKASALRPKTSRKHSTAEPKCTSTATAGFL
jgi:transglutaminase-like putative cysteine protease